MSKRRNAGLTITEVVIAIALFGILTLIALPKFINLSETVGLQESAQPSAKSEEPRK